MSAASEGSHIRTITLKVFAKVNLILQVLGKRDDGYHNISTILQNIDLADILTFKEAPRLTLEDFGLGIQDNLVWKAAHLLKSYAKTGKGAFITLRKNIPVQAGLGGGSADAAATLIALNELWDLDLPAKALLDLGARLGSDVNFFLTGGLVLATGRGEIVQPIKSPLKLAMVIAKPNFGITAKEAYELWDKGRRAHDVDIGSLIEKINEGSIKAEDFFNDLEASVLKKYEQLEKIFAGGYKAGASKVMLSGSGPAVVAFTDVQGQDNVYKAFKEENLMAYKVKTMDRSVEKIEN